MAININCGTVIKTIIRNNQKEINIDAVLLIKLETLSFISFPTNMLFLPGCSLGSLITYSRYISLVFCRPSQFFSLSLFFITSTPWKTPGHKSCLMFSRG